MSEQTENTSDKPSPFEERLTLVKEEIKKRISTKPPEQHDYYRARLWIRWIKQNILAKKRHVSGPINCDLYPWRTAKDSTEGTPA